MTIFLNADDKHWIVARDRRELVDAPWRASTPTITITFCGSLWHALGAKRRE